jgi:hypothetical protein
MRTVVDSLHSLSDILLSIAHNLGGHFNYLFCEENTFFLTTSRQDMWQSYYFEVFFAIDRAQETKTRMHHHNRGDEKSPRLARRPLINKLWESGGVSPRR